MTGDRLGQAPALAAPELAVPSSPEARQCLSACLPDQVLVHRGGGALFHLQRAGAQRAAGAQARFAE